MNINEDFKYSKEHEWVELLDHGKARVGVSDYAQEALGDVVYVSLPAEGDNVQEGESIGSIESVKAASDIYSPLSGEVTEVNEAITDSPELVNTDPYTEGWLFEIKMDDASEVDNLLNADEYAQFLETSEQDK